jgi:hypothetical protein
MGFESMPKPEVEEQEAPIEETSETEMEKNKNRLEYLQHAFEEAEKEMENSKKEQTKAEEDAENLKQELSKIHEASGWKEMDDNQEYQTKDKLRRDLIKDARRHGDNWMKAANEQSNLRAEKEKLEAELK